MKYRVVLLDTGIFSIASCPPEQGETGPDRLRGGTAGIALEGAAARSIASIESLR